MGKTYIAGVGVEAVQYMAVGGAGEAGGLAGLLVVLVAAAEALGAVVEGIAKGFVGALQRVAAGHEDLSSNGTKPGQRLKAAREPVVLGGLYSYSHVGDGIWIHERRTQPPKRSFASTWRCGNARRLQADRVILTLSKAVEHARGWVATNIGLVYMMDRYEGEKEVSGSMLRVCLKKQVGR